MILIVKAVGEPSSPEDADVAGEYEIEVHEDMEEADAAACALDVFHSNVSVDVLDDFEFEVRPESGDRIIEPNPDRESYELAKMGHLVCKLGAPVTLDLSIREFEIVKLAVSKLLSHRPPGRPPRRREHSELRRGGAGP
jgi:hypothetical protein